MTNSKAKILLYIVMVPATLGGILVAGDGAVTASGSGPHSPQHREAVTLYKEAGGLGALTLASIIGVAALGRRQEEPV